MRASWYCLTIIFVFLAPLDLLLSSALSTEHPKVSGKGPALLPAESLLSFTHYLQSCPAAEGIIQQRVQAAVGKDYSLAAAIIRLHFHDCAVRGCDASVLLNHPGSERRAYASRTLRGFEVIDDIKTEIEKRCPRTVSCADILTAAARDATIFAGGPFWEVPFGRKDGRISMAAEAEQVPQGHENVTSLIDYFRVRGLDVLDLVTLSGAHTIGRTTCYTIMDRLYDFNKTRKPDPQLTLSFLKLLRKRCTKETNVVVLDVITPTTFDNVFYNNLQKKVGVLSTDQALQSDARTAPFVQIMASQPFLFSSQFSSSMVKLGNVGVLTRKNEGEIRVNCNFINP